MGNITYLNSPEMMIIFVVWNVFIEFYAYVFRVFF